MSAHLSCESAERAAFRRDMALFVFLALASGHAQAAPPDAAYVNGNIYTVDPARPRAEALAVLGDRIVAVGSNAEIQRLAGPSMKTIDLGGKTILPGLIDAHCHVAGLGSFGLGRIDLSDARSYNALVATVAERVKQARPGAWILGGRWDHESWAERRLPTHAALSAVSPDNPVWLTRVDGHAGLANAAALKLAGIQRDTPAPPGGAILKDEHAEPTGVFIDNAMDLIAGHIDQAGTDPAALILKAQEMCLAVGLTGVHDAGISPAEVEVYQKLADSGQLKLRVYAMIAGRYAAEYFAARGLLIGDRLTVQAAKVYADGALGSRGAWLLAPYADRPTDDAGQPYVGLAVEPELIRTLAEDGLRRGYQVCTHAIGDRGNRETLDAYAAALRQSPHKDHRFRIEHAQVLALEDIPRFAELGVLPAMQPTHCTSDMRWVEARIGPQRAAGAYAWAKLRRTGVPIPGGSDFPVESHNPLLGIYAAVTRQTTAGQPPGGWHREERMTREEALRSFTSEAAYAAFEEDRKGSLAAGKLADFIVLDRDIMTCEPADIPQARVLLTVIGGETVYDASTGAKRE
jgi:hypothetical protein